MARDWSNLNNDLLRLIAGKVRTLQDVIRFGAVCSNWISAIIFDCPHQLPWLMLPPFSDSDRQDQCRPAFSMMENKVHHFDFSEAYGNKFVGSSHGWLVMRKDDSPALFMLNPLTTQRIELPPVTTMPDILGFNKEDVGHEYIYRDYPDGEVDRMSLKDIGSFINLKIILSSDPNEEDCIAVAICGQLSRLVFCRIGDNKWTYVEHNLVPPQNDVVYSNDNFFVVNCNGRVGIFDVKNPQVKIIHEPPSCIDKRHSMYLVVDTTGALLLISRWVEFLDSLSEDDEDDQSDDEGGEDDEDDQSDDEEPPDDNQSSNPFYRTKEFNVFKLDDEKKEWNKVRDIGENMVFLGVNQSICYSTIDFPEGNQNSIYFTHDRWEYKGGIEGGHDVGIYNIEDGLITKVPCFKEDMPPLLTIFPRPVWFTPSIRQSKIKP